MCFIKYKIDPIIFNCVNLLSLRYMNEEKKIVNTLSEHLFWDVDKSNIDEQKHKKYIITKVLQYGFYSDWKKLLRFYGLETIINVSKTIRDLDKKTLSFLSLIGEIPENKFLCYTTGQSIPKYWNF